MLIIPQLPRFLSVQTQWAVEINMPRGSTKLVGCVRVNRILMYINIKIYYYLWDFTGLPD